MGDFEETQNVFPTPMGIFLPIPMPGRGIPGLLSSTQWGASWSDSYVRSFALRESAIQILEEAKNCSEKLPTSLKSVPSLIAIERKKIKLNNYFQTWENREWESVFGFVFKVHSAGHPLKRGELKV